MHHLGNIPKPISSTIADALPVTKMSTIGIIPFVPIVTPQKIGEWIYGKY
jgi:hypothetical protein